MKTELLYGIVASSKTRVRCIFCGVYIPKAKKCIEQHTNGIKHRENIALRAQNGIKEENDVLHCGPCGRALHEEESVSKHADDETHLGWIDKLYDLKEDDFINFDLYIAGERDEVLCEACYVLINSSFDSMNDHVKLFDHQTNVVKALKPLNGIFRVDNDDEVWCKLCDAYVENTYRGVLDHIDDDIHQNWFTDVLDLIDDQDVSIDDYLANEHEMHAFCNKCQVQVPCDLSKLEEHVYSDSHLNQFS